MIGGCCRIIWGGFAPYSARVLINYKTSKDPPALCPPGTARRSPKTGDRIFPSYEIDGRWASMVPAETKGKTNQRSGATPERRRTARARRTRRASRRGPETNGGRTDLGAAPRMGSSRAAFLLPARASITTDVRSFVSPCSTNCGLAIVQSHAAILLRCRRGSGAWLNRTSYRSFFLALVLQRFCSLKHGL